MKKAKGNSGHRPIKTADIEAEAHAAAKLGETGSTEIQPPDWLNADGRKVWAELAPRLSAMKILQVIDAHTFARYCQVFGRWVQLEKVLNDEGTTYESESPHGSYVRSHPAFMQADRLNRSLIQMESGFGLNPADRQRLFAARAAAANTPGLFDPGVSGEKKDKTGAIGVLN
ncbi:phage terminase small subunit P27 family [Pseudooceanicola algae]|uniref:phage terminase small subunit P27 family n=1 Tax=Pseudooceanicola algae TaxID=1537215 RepID=UPI0018AD27BA|nr:phage terminase small subunit P27 family [Pseudooceanicola algae]